MIDAFQVYAGKRVQRLFGKSPNICAFYGLGWVRLERYIEVKKLLFIRSILILDPMEPSRKVFCSRMDDYLGSPDTRGQDIHGGVVFDLLNTASNFCVLDDVVSMVRQGHYWPKDLWKRKIWKLLGRWMNVSGV